ncbi:MAG: hypothetical protein V3T84_04820 [Phycisphaerales bacterium]
MKLIQRLRRKAAQLLFPRPIFATDDVKIGRHVTFGRNVVFNCSRVRIGDGVSFGDNIIVNSDVFEIGDYGTIYDYCFFPGPGTLRIGHNFWLGTSCIVDAQGGTTIGNNVGAGAHSQLWTHIQFGDVAYGCRFHGSRSLVIQDDVWLVGHCLVSPVHIGARSIAMLGSVVTRDMEPDHCYAGVPAKDMTDKFGPQFKISTVETRVAYLARRLDEFTQETGTDGIRERVKVVARAEDMNGGGEGVTVFNVADRTYLKLGTRLEYRLMRFLLPDAKFLPVEETGTHHHRSPPRSARQPTTQPVPARVRRSPHARSADLHVR